MTDQLFFFSPKFQSDWKVGKEELGGKGMGLVEMTKAGFPVPPGFIIPTTRAKAIIEGKGEGSAHLLEMLAMSAKQHVEGFIADAVGGDLIPLVSVRSGARVSMPGMMDTILNVGLTEKNLLTWQGKIGKRNALDCYRRLIQMYGQTVADIDSKHFKAVLKYVMDSKYGQKTKPTSESTMSEMHLQKLIEGYLKVYETQSGEEFPQTLEEQLMGAIGAVFNSWNSDRAIAYRKEHKIPNDWYTACTVQAMVFGNMGHDSCSGVLFSRDKATGENEIQGEFLPNAQGEEVVSGTATPMKLKHFGSTFGTFELAQQLVDLVGKLEKSYKDMVDIEFTVQQGKLWLLQSRVGKRSAHAAFKIAYDMVMEGKLSKKEALKRVTGEQYATLSRPTIDPSFKGEPIATGLAGSKGIATGKVWMTSEKAEKNPGGILVAHETTPDDFVGMAASKGILTQTGGITSHAAVVANGMDRACVVGCTSITVEAGGFKYGDSVVVEGDVITIDGGTGRVWKGEVPMVGGKVPSFVIEMIEWGNGAAGKMIKFDAQKDHIPQEGEIYLSMTSLKSPGEVDFAMQQLAKLPKLGGVISFEESTSSFDDSKFLSILAVPKQSYVNPVCVAECLKYENSPIAKNWTIVAGVELVGQTKGFRIHKRVSKLGDLMKLTGYYELTAELEELAKAQNLDIEKFAQVLKAAGQEIKPMPKPVSREALAFVVFGQ